MKRHAHIKDEWVRMKWEVGNEGTEFLEALFYIQDIFFSEIKDLNFVPDKF